MKRVAVIQSNYIPWKGYFDIIRNVDLFIFHDDLQYTKNDWRNRNKIKTERGPEWITIPVGTNEHRMVCEVEIKDSAWQKMHWGLITRHYRNAPHLARYTDFFEDVYLRRTWSSLSVLNQFLIQSIAREFLDIRTEFADSRVFAPVGAKQDRLIDLLKKAGASSYLSGPAARSYIEPAKFADAGIELNWQAYEGYPEYQQVFPPFEHGVSIVDLLFNTGSDAAQYIWGWRGN